MVLGLDPNIVSAVLAAAATTAGGAAFGVRLIRARRARNRTKAELTRRLDALLSLVLEVRQQYEILGAFAQRVRSTYNDLKEIDKIQLSKDWRTAHYRLIAKLKAFDNEKQSLGTYLLSDTIRTNLDNKMFSCLTVILSNDVVKNDELIALSPFSDFQFTGWASVTNAIDDAKLLSKAR